MAYRRPETTRIQGLQRTGIRRQHQALTIHLPKREGIHW
jgi:hypothetical protein